jgi:hypothetical protein
MRIRRPGLVALTVAGIVACACAREKQVASLDTAATVEQAGSTLATRREALGQLDSARASFVRKDVATTARLLRSAVAFTRSEVATAPETGRPFLLNAADVLDTLALQVERGKVTSVQRLDQAFARLHQAEARFHLARAHEAWAAKGGTRASGELLMATDHLERTAVDTRIRLDGVEKRVIADARSLAARLDGRQEVSSEEFDRTATALGVAVSRVGGKLQKQQSKM